MSCLVTNSIDFCGLSAPGIKSLFITNKAFISGVTFTDDTLSIIQDFVAAAGVGEIWWLKFSVNPTTTQVLEELQRGDRGRLYKADLDTTFIKVEADKRTALEQLLKVKTVAVVEDNNGKYWSIGEEQGLELINYSATTGAQEGVNNYSVKLTTYNLNQIREVDLNTVSNFFVAVEDCSIYAGEPIQDIPPPLQNIFDCLIDFSN